MNYLISNIQRPVPLDILFSDDIVLIDEDSMALQAMLEKWKLALKKVDLRISRKKIEHALQLFKQQRRLYGITLQNTALKTVNHLMTTRLA